MLLGLTTDVPVHTAISSETAVSGIVLHQSHPHDDSGEFQGTQRSVDSSSERENPGEPRGLLGVSWLVVLSNK